MNRTRMRSSGRTLIVVIGAVLALTTQLSFAQGRDRQPTGRHQAGVANSAPQSRSHGFEMSSGQLDRRSETDVLRRQTEWDRSEARSQQQGPDSAASRGSLPEQSSEQASTAPGQTDLTGLDQAQTRASEQAAKGLEQATSSTQNAHSPSQPDPGAQSKPQESRPTQQPARTEQAGKRPPQ